MLGNTQGFKGLLLMWEDRAPECCLPQARGEFRAAARAAEDAGAHIMLADRRDDKTALRLKRLTPYSELMSAFWAGDSLRE